MAQLVSLDFLLQWKCQLLEQVKKIYFIDIVSSIVKFQQDCIKRKNHVTVTKTTRAKREDLRTCANASQTSEITCEQDSSAESSHK